MVVGSAIVFERSDRPLADDVRHLATTVRARPGEIGAIVRVAFTARRRPAVEHAMSRRSLLLRGCRRARPPSR